MRAGRVDLDRVAERCQERGLLRMAEQLPELLEEASREDLTPMRFLEWEYERKEERRVEMLLRMSGLPPGKTLDSFDRSFQPRADRAKVEELATCAFARRAESILFLGPPGVGKSHLATGLGVKAIKNGFRVHHYVLDELIRMLQAEETTPYRRRPRRYRISSVLIIDEVGFRPLNREEANLFFRLVSRRYERGSLILTSNKQRGGLAGGVRGGRGVDHGDPGSSSAPRPCGPDQRPELPAEGTRRPPSRPRSRGAPHPGEGVRGMHRGGAGSRAPRGWSHASPPERSFRLGVRPRSGRSAPSAWPHPEPKRLSSQNPPLRKHPKAAVPWSTISAQKLVSPTCAKVGVS